MHDRLDAQVLKNSIGEDERRSQFYAASLAAIERFSEQLDRKDRHLELKDERLQTLERELVQLRAAIASLQRTNDDARSAYNAAQIDRQRTIDRLYVEIEELRGLRDELRSSDEARGRLLEKIAALEAALVAVREQATADRARDRAELYDELREERDRLNRIVTAEIDRTRAQIAEVDASIVHIQRSFFWRLKLRLAALRSPFRSMVRAAVRR